MSDTCGACGRAVLDAMDPAPSDVRYPWRDGRMQGEGASTYIPDDGEPIGKVVYGGRGKPQPYAPPTAYVQVGEHVWREVPTSADRIKAASERVLDLLLEKNQSYGDTALNPLRILSKLDAYEGLAVRADDKLSRLKNAPEAFQEDALLDLAGYLILMLAARGEA